MDQMKAFVLYSALFLLAPKQADAQIAVIVNKSVPLKTASASKIARIYTIDTQRWSNGDRIVMFNLKKKSEAKEKFYGFINKKSSELKRTWMRLQLTGEGKPPRALKTENEVLQKVASTPDAIGYVSLEKVTDKVKVIAIIE